MTEILTESFCERCGTRYTFEPVVSRRKALSGIGTLGRGIRHFVSDPGTTLDEAMAVARSESEQRSTASALEAFHRTFNFCLSCRQYTCADCWNTVEGRCLSCAPTPDAAPPITRVDTAVPLPPMDLAVSPVHVHEAPPHVTVDPVAEAAADASALADAAALAEGDARAAAAAAVAEAEAAETLAREAADAETAARAAEELAARDAADTAAAAEAREAAEAAEAAAREADAAAVEADARRVAEEEAQAVADALAVAEAAAMAAIADADARAATEAAEREAAEAALTAATLAAEAEAEAEASEAAEAEAEAEAERASLAFEPGLNLDEQIAAYERDQASVGVDEAIAEPVEALAEAEPEPILAEAAPEPEPVIVEPEPIIATAPIEAEPEPEVVEPEIVEPEIVEPEPLPVAADRAAAAAAEPIPTAIGQPIPASTLDGPLSWPEREVAAATFEPAWPNPSTPSQAAMTAAPGAGLPAAESAPPPSPARACPSCGLSLSASARFCRRCGTPQQLDAPN